MYINRVTVMMLSNASVHTLLIMTVDGLCTIYVLSGIRYQGIRESYFTWGGLYPKGLLF